MKEMDEAIKGADAETKQTAWPARTGACPFCVRKHLLKARGYAREISEDSTREWERDNLLENLLLAEDHAVALRDTRLASSIRSVRISVENGTNVSWSIDKLYDDFKSAYSETFRTKDSSAGGNGAF